MSEEIKNNLLNDDHMNRWQKIRDQAGPMGSFAIEAEQHATHDELTGLLNRRGVLAKVGSLIDDIDEHPDKYIVMFLDLDGFKNVNDTHGHKAGDKVLKSVGNKLTLRDTDTAGRLGGDEFLVVVDTEAESPERRSPDRVDENPRRQKRSKEEVIEGLTGHIKDQVIEGGVEAGYDGVSASIGVVNLKDFKNANTLLQAADARMYQDKEVNKALR